MRFVVGADGLETQRLEQLRLRLSVHDSEFGIESAGYIGLIGLRITGPGLSSSGPTVYGLELLVDLAASCELPELPGCLQLLQLLEMMISMTTTMLVMMLMMMGVAMMARVKVMVKGMT